MRITFDADAANGHRGNLHVFNQVNFRYDSCLNILSLFEHDNSPFEVALDISEIEEILRWYEVFCSAVGDQEVSRRSKALANGENRLASLALNDGSVSRFFHVLTKLARIIRFIEHYHEFEAEGFELNDCLKYIQWLDLMPDPPEHDLKIQKRRRREIAGDIVKIGGRNILVKKLTVQDVFEDARRLGGCEVRSVKPEAEPPAKRRQWISNR